MSIFFYKFQCNTAVTIQEYTLTLCIKKTVDRVFYNITRAPSFLRISIKCINNEKQEKRT